MVAEPADFQQLGNHLLRSEIGEWALMGTFSKACMNYWHDQVRGFKVDQKNNFSRMNNQEKEIVYRAPQS